MKLLVFYGPPAVGKLTIAEAVAVQTDFKLYHNHLTWNMVTSIFEFRSEAYFRLLTEMRTLMFAEAAKANINVAFTYVYALARAEASEQYFRAVEENGGEVCLVQLSAEYKTLEQHVTNPSRTQHGKLNTREGLKEFFERSKDGGIDVPVAGRESLFIDTGKMAVADSAELLISHYNLK